MEHPIFPLSPRRLISLADMIRFVMEEYQSAHTSLNEWTFKLISASSASKHQGEISESESNTLLTDLKNLLPLCSKLGLPQTERLIGQLKIELGPKGVGRNYTGIQERVKSLWWTMHDEAKDKTFAFIPSNRVFFCNNDLILGKTVKKAFPSAVKEAKEAGNCVAIEAYTASVFHLMRAAEHGLRALARKLKVNRVKRNTPIEYATWGEIIDALAKKVDALPRPKNTRGAQTLEFYQQAIRTCDALKDLWRNPVSHLRGNFNEAKAGSVFYDVRDFFQNLSKRLKESKP